MQDVCVWHDLQKFLSQSVALGLAIPGAVIFVSLCSLMSDMRTDYRRERLSLLRMRRRRQGVRGSR